MLVSPRHHNGAPSVKRVTPHVMVVLSLEGRPLSLEALRANGADGISLGVDQEPTGGGGEIMFEGGGMGS